MATENDEADGEEFDEELDGEEFDGEEGEFDDEESVEVGIEPKQDVLDSLGVTPEEFDETLAKALDEFEAYVEGLPDDAELPTLDEAPITLRGRTFTLGEVATIEVFEDEAGDEEE